MTSRAGGDNRRRTCELSCALRRRDIAVAAVIVFAVVVAMSGSATAEDYPTRPISVVVPFPAGGPIDATARIVGEGMQARLGKPVIVVNRPGAQGLIGAQAALEAPADGHTLFFGVVSSLNNVLVPRLPFDILERMEPIGQVSIGSFCIYANAKVPVKTLQELVDYAKQKPGDLNYGAQAASTTLGMEMLKHKAGIDIVGIPYQGGGPAIIALVANEIQVLMDAPGGTVLSSVEAGTIRALACSGATRHRALPNIPTTSEAGFPDVRITVTNGFWGPKGIAPARVRILGDAIRTTVESPSSSERIEKLGTYPQPANAAELLNRTTAERAFWIEAARLSNYQPK